MRVTPKHMLQVNRPMFETRPDRMLDAETDEITSASRYERSGSRKPYQAGRYVRDLMVRPAD